MGEKENTEEEEKMAKSHERKAIKKSLWKTVNAYIETALDQQNIWNVNVYK